jgi:DNA-binding NarL/FixJ family response regulator
MMSSSPTTPVRILLVEDHAVFRQALALAFGLQPNFEVVAEAGSVAEARGLLGGIDVGVFDLDLPDGNGATLIKELHEQNRGAEALVLTASVRQVDHARAVEAGAAGLVHKSTPLNEIVDAVQRVARGETLISRRELIDLVQLAGKQREQEQATRQIVERLTPRERQVLVALGEGLSDREIAERLFISRDTVHTHMVNMMGKLDVDSRMQALIFAIRSGLVTLD